MALTISEEWIRERVQLKHNNLEDVRALSLPGTYHEKIAGVGSSLRSFFRLKQLDLSRNAVDTLQGLENLKLLEKLNLYYNNVSNLRELYRLRHNQQLQEVDLRLNPVARNEPDYRLFLIHMLPNLRRLDDRAVRDTERKAALMHFSSEQATQLTHHKQSNKPFEEKRSNPRLEHVKTLGKPGVLEDDDVALLDMIAHAELSKDPRPLTGSKAKTPAVEEYSADSVREMDYHGVGLGDEPVTKVISADTQYSAVPTLPYSETYQMSIGVHARSGPEKHQHHQPPAGVDLDDLQAKYPHIPVIPTISTSPPTPESEDIASSTPPLTTTKQSTAKRNRVQFANDPNLKFQDEIEAYTSYKATGHFTPCPGTGNESQDIQVENSAKTQQTKPANEFPRSNHERNWTKPYYSAELYRDTPSQSENESAITQESSGYLLSQHSIPDTQSNFSTGNHHQMALGSKLDGINPPEGTVGDIICKISDLVDKYWNGAKSLVANQRFTSQINQLLRQQSSVVEPPSTFSSMSGMGPSDPDAQRQIQHLRNEIAKLRDENAHLRSKFVSLSPDLENADESKMKSSLLRAQRDLSILRSRLQGSLVDNRQLQDQLANLESKSDTKRPSDLTDIKQITSLTQENARMNDELRRVNEELKRSSQMHEMSSLLQQSHTSLLKTNEHLMREMEVMRRGHQDVPRSYSPDTADSMPVYLPEPSRPSSYASHISRYAQNVNHHRPSAMNGCS